jgi:protein TonB
MGNFFSVRPARDFQTTKEESWIERVLENARAFFELRRAVLAPGGGGAFNLLEERPEPGRRKRQASSLVVHAAALGILLWMGGRVAKDPLKLQVLVPESGPLKYIPFKASKIEQQGRGNGTGGAKDPLPPTAGDWAARSQVVLIHPRLPENAKPALPAEPTVFDPNANETRHVDNLGLPMMRDRNHSNGQNGDDGMGNKQGHTMGTRDGEEEGNSFYSGPPVQGAYPVKCVYCPDPEYTDEARHEKLQGNVTLQVLVTPDGRVGRVRITKGLGLGLDERAAETVRKWRFQAARDAARNPIAQWVTVETTYRLF